MGDFCHIDNEKYLFGDLYHIDIASYATLFLLLFLTFDLFRIVCV